MVDFTSLGIPGLSGLFQPTQQPAVGPAAEAVGEPQQTLLATPTNFSNPEHLAAMRDYAKALLGDSQKPVTHWTQGINHMVDALVGGNQDYAANQRQNEAQSVTAGQRYVDPAGAPAGISKSFSDGPTSEGQSNSGGKVASSNPRGIRNQNPGNIEDGPFARSQPGYAGSDGRFAKYASMDDGTHAMGALLDNYGKQGINTVSGVISRWAPPSDGNNTSAYASDVAKRLGIDPNAPIPPKLRPQLIAAMAQHENGRALPPASAQPAMAFSGQPSSGVSPATTAITSALRGGQPDPASGVQPVANKTPATPPSMNSMPQPNGAGIYYDPKLINTGPQYNEGQIRGALANPYIPEETKRQMQQQYLQQAAPIELPWPGGHVLIDRQNPQNQQFIPDLQKRSVDVGGIKVDQYGTIGQPGSGGPGVQFNPATSPPLPIGPRSEATPASPVTPAGGPAMLTPSPTPVVAQSAPTAAPAPPTPPAVPNPIQVASLDPAAGVAQAAAQQASVENPHGAPVVSTGENGDASPEKPIPIAANVAQPDVPLSANGLTQLAANDSALRSLVGDDIWNAATQKKDYDVSQDLKQKGGEADIEVDKTAREDNNKLSSKRYEDLMGKVQAAVDDKNNLQQADALMQQPGFYSGLASGSVELWNKAKAALNIDPNAAEPMEVFRKTVAKNVMNGLKEAFQGMGQIRVAEIQLQNQASANLSNTPAANAALIEISRRNADRVLQIGDLATQYRLGGEVVDPVSGETLLPANTGPDGTVRPRNGLDPQYDKILRKFETDHPTFSKEEYADFTKTLASKGQTNADGTPTGAPPTTGALPASPKAGDRHMFNDGHGGTTIGKFDGKNWGPDK